jgi:hypothetical protein
MYSACAVAVVVNSKVLGLAPDLNRVGTVCLFSEHKKNESAASSNLGNDTHAQKAAVPYQSSVSF